MSASASSGPDASNEARSGFGRAFLTLVRALGSTVALVAIYYLLPLDRSSIGVAIGMLTVGLLALVGLVAFQVRSIIRAAYPALRAMGALATSVPLFLLLFSGTYFVMGTISAGNFSQPITRTDALYFTVTVFATVGFGDITAVTEAARVLVTGQMIAGSRDHRPRRQDHRRRGQARAAAATDSGETVIAGIRAALSLEGCDLTNLYLHHLGTSAHRAGLDRLNVREHKGGTSQPGAEESEA